MFPALPRVGHAMSTDMLTLPELPWTAMLGQTEQGSDPTQHAINNTKTTFLSSLFAKTSSQTEKMPSLADLLCAPQGYFHVRFESFMINSQPNKNTLNVRILSTKENLRRK